MPISESQSVDVNEIVYFDRYQNRTCVEQVYGDRALRWTYGTALGKLTLSAMVKRIWFSRWYGWRMDRAASRRKIRPFIEQYDLDATEFVRRPEEFESFNAFFHRALRPEARPVDTDSSSIVFPADGRHLCVPDLSQSTGLFVKGEMFDVAELLEDPQLADEFEGGSLLLSRLCPVDYHRFHFPVAGRPGRTRPLNGPLYSVNPIALRQNIQILATNKRCLTLLESDALGKVLLIEVGATCVGGICQTYRADTNISKGDEKGYFRFGGSSVIVIFQRGSVRFEQDLIENSARHRELFARVGDRAATIL